MSFKIPVLPPGLNPTFKRVSYDEDALLSEPEVPTFEPVPTPPLPDTYGTVTNEPPAPVETPEVATEPDEFAGVEKDTKMALMEYIRGKLGKKAEGSIFDRPEFQKGNMALYYAGLGKELPAGYFEKGETDDSKRLNSAVGALNALRGMKGKSAGGPEADRLAQDVYIARLTALKDSPQYAPFYREFVETGKIRGMTSEDLKKHLQPVLGHAGVDTRSEANLNLRTEQFGHQKDMDAIRVKQAEERIAQGWAGQEITKDKMFQGAVQSSKDLIPLRTAFNQMERDIPNVTFEGADAEVLKKNGINSWSQLRQKLPALGLTRHYDDAKLARIQTLAAQIQTQINHKDFGANFTGTEQQLAELRMYSALLDDPTQFYQILPLFAESINDHLRANMAVAEKHRPELVKQTGLGVPVQPKAQAPTKKAGEVLAEQKVRVTAPNGTSKVLLKKDAMKYRGQAGFKIEDVK